MWLLPSATSFGASFQALGQPVPRGQWPIECSIRSLDPRLISSQFIHGSILHLLNNMYALIFAGIALAPIVRKAGLIACYLLAGLGGSVASAVVHPATVSVGASGSIFGLFGVLLTLLALRDERIAQIRSFILVNSARFHSPPIIRAACRRQRRWVRRVLADIPPRRLHPPTSASPAARRSANAVQAPACRARMNSGI